MTTLFIAKLKKDLEPSAILDPPCLRYDTYYRVYLSSEIVHISSWQLKVRQVLLQRATSFLFQSATEQTRGKIVL